MSSIAAADASADADSFVAPEQARKHCSTSDGRNLFPPASRLYSIASISFEGAAAHRSRSRAKYALIASPSRFRIDSASESALLFSPTAIVTFPLAVLAARL